KEVAAIRTEDEAVAARVKLEPLLKGPLTAETAVQIALLNNRGLQAAYNDLGIAEAVRIQQSLPPNPTISVTRITGSAETEIDRQIVASILALATLPARSEIAAERFRQAQFLAALETLHVAAETRRAFYRAVAAQELVGLLTQADSAAATMAQLAKRLGETGAMNKLDQARELAFHAELTAQLAAAQQRAASERERLVRLLGLWGNDLRFMLAKAMPALPKRALTLPANAFATAVSRYRSKFPCLISAKRACAKPNRPICRPSTVSRKRRSMCGRRRAMPIAITGPPTRSRATTSATCCRCARSFPTK